MKLDGGQIFIWVAVEVESGVLVMMLTGEPFMNVFLNKVLKTCLNMPQVYVDRGYIEA